MSPSTRAAALRVGGVLLVLAATAQALLLLWIDHYPAPRPLFGDEVTYWGVASQWSVGERADLDLLWPRLYPAFLSVLMQAGASRLGVQLVQLLLLAASALLLGDLVRRLLGPATGVGAAALLVLDPQIVAFACYFWPEILHLFLGIAATWTFVVGGSRWGWSAVVGALTGAALLTKNLLGPMVPVAALGTVAASGRHRLTALAVASAALVAMVLPTMVGNGRQHGAFVIGDSALFNVWVGLNDTERHSLVNDRGAVEYQRYREGGDTHRERVDALEARIRDFIQSRGVGRVVREQLGRQYFRLFDRDSFFTVQLPGGSIERPGGSYQALGERQAALLRTWASGLYLLVLVLAPFGFLVVYRRHRWAAITVLGYVGMTLAICLVIHVKSRYRVQLMPALYVCAAAAAGLGPAFTRPASEPRRRALVQLGSAAGVAALLVCFAIGRDW